MVQVSPGPRAPGRDRVVWSGRHENALTGGLDDWNTSRAGLHQDLARAGELVVLDALSFPWQVLRQPERAIPLVVVLPDDLDADTVSKLLGRVLFSHLTPFDRVLCRHPEVRRDLQARWHVPPVVWWTAHAETETDPWWVGPLAEHFQQDLVEVTSDIGRFLCARDDLVSHHLETYGAHQRATLEALLEVVQEGDHVIDVGAHVGTFAVPLGARVGPTGRLLAVEAAASTHSLLTHNVTLNGIHGWTRVERAVVTRSGRRLATVRSAVDNSGARQFLVDDGPSRADVPTRTLDELAAAGPAPLTPALVKVDVEGAELEVLEGAGALVEAAKPVLCLEVSASQLATFGRRVDELDRWLHARDYRVFLVAGERHGVSPRWQLAPLKSLGEVDQPLFDVLAVPADSDRLAAVGGGRQE